MHWYYFDANIYREIKDTCPIGYSIMYVLISYLLVILSVENQLLLIYNYFNLTTNYCTQIL